jgi:hypothetical protein
VLGFRAHRAVVVLAVVLSFAVGLRLAVAFAWPSIVWPDEIFQSLEQAHRLVFGYGIVPWEFRDGARSWLFPGLLAGAMELGRPFGGLGHVRAVQIALALVSIVPVGVAFVWSSKRHGIAEAIVASLACATWFEIVYFSARSLTEVAAAHVVVAALYLAPGDEERKGRLLAAGAAFGLAAALRIHLVPAIAVAIGLICWRSWHRWQFVLAGAGLSVVGAGLLDMVTWSGPFSSFWVNFRYNVLEGNSVKFGVQPWYGYLTRLWSIWSWGALPLLALAAIGAIRNPAAAAFAVVTLLTHSALKHKEYRFVYPVVLVVVLLASQGLAEISALLAARARVRPALAAGAAVLAWAVLSGWRAERFESDGSYGFTQTGESMWHQRGAGIEATARLGADQQVCGVGLVRIHWAWTGGYSYLHRDVPIYLVADGRMFRTIGPAVNAVIVTRELAPALRGYTVEQCWADMCIARRQGTCTSTGAPAINEMLVRFGA